MSNSQTENKAASESLSDTTKSSIKALVQELLGKCKTPFKNLLFDGELYNDCKEVLSSKFHLPLSLYPYLEKYLSVGVEFTFTCYSHLPKHNQMFVVIYGVLTVVLDDVFCENNKQMEGFNERFARGLPQGDPILDALAQLLLDASEYYNRVQSNLIVTSTLDFVTSLIMDLEFRKIASFKAPGFATYWRLNMSSACVAYAMVIFSKDIDVALYMQCLPHLVVYMLGVNDVLSLYKEEVAGEEDNFPTMLVKESGVTKYEAIQHIVNDVAEADQHILKGLADNQPALDSWQSFKRGYVPFHFSCPRYKLDELFEGRVIN
ncbi:hypothetical protein E1B28_001858 [Marasmius oreades]|uniref:Uncharacterized protein n=1 Tax=Marasmius oreades TaxID=181124 RepID=A0A9P7V480_9AGAR|nr:uncharacterized protein E1B28_001858 [Marasmius oreades]KAG7100075.1 hypothetical protein E1B28_001858 [Marasmius oreades]